MAAIRIATSDHSSLNLRTTLPAFLIIPTIPIPGIQNRSSPICPVEAAVPTHHQRRGFQRKSTKAERQTGNALTVAGEATTPTVVLNMHGNVQRVKAQIDCSALSIFYRRVYLGNWSYHLNQHSSPPWPGDDVCRESNAQSLCSVFEHLKPDDEPEVLVVPIKVYDLVFGWP